MVAVSLEFLLVLVVDIELLLQFLISEAERYSGEVLHWPGVFF